MIIKMHHICIYYSFIITMDTIQIIFCYYIHSIRNSIYSVPMKKKVNTLMHIIVSLYDSIFHTHFAFVLFFFYKRWVWVMCHEMAAIILSLYTHLYLIGGGGVKKRFPVTQPNISFIQTQQWTIQITGLLKMNESCHTCSVCIVGKLRMFLKNHSSLMFFISCNLFSMVIAYNNCLYW